MKKEIIAVTQLDQLNQEQINQVIGVYQAAFAGLPYLELFTAEQSLGALQYILDRQGDLLICEVGGQAVSLAGGYMRQDDIYYIEELAVRPDKQRQGFGRDTLKQLLSVGLQQKPRAFEIRTTVNNDKAINLYESEGFKLSGNSVVVPQIRQGGKIGLDERVYLKKYISGEQAKTNELPKLRRVAVAYPSGNTTAVVFDQPLGVDRELLNTQIMSG